MKLLTLVALVLALTGCATAPPPLPEGSVYVCYLGEGA